MLWTYGFPSSPSGPSYYLVSIAFAIKGIQNILLNGIKVLVFSEKNIEKKHLCRRDKNYYYFCKSNIAVINLIVDSRIWSNFQKRQVCKEIDKRRESFFPNTDNFLAFIIIFEWGKIFGSAMDKQEVKGDAKLRPYYFSMNVFVIAVVFHRQILKTDNFAWNCWLFLICRQNTTASTKTFKEI